MVSLVAQLFIETARAVAGSAFARRESNPLDRGERFQLVLTIIPPSCSPDASAMRRAYCALRVCVVRSRSIRRGHDLGFDGNIPGGEAGVDGDVLARGLDLVHGRGGDGRSPDVD